jgi:hypothetical protein
MGRTPNNLSTMFEFIEKLVIEKCLQFLKEYQFLVGLESYQQAPLVCSMLYVLYLYSCSTTTSILKPIFHVEWKLSMNEKLFPILYI